MDVSPPVIERVEETIQQSENQEPFRVIAFGSNFVPCLGGMMVSRVRSVAGPLTPIGKSESTWVVKEWMSADLRGDMPTTEDFIVSIPPSVHVIGLKNAPPIGTIRRIELAAYSIDDLDLVGGVTGVADQAETQDQGPWAHLRWLVVSATIAAITCLSYLVVQKQWRRRATGRS